MDVVTLPGHNPGPWTGAGNNTYLLTGRVPTLIDAGVGHPRHLDALAAALERGAARMLAHVLVTHGHVDHASGAPALARRWPGAIFRKMPWSGDDGSSGVRWAPLGDEERVEAGDASLRVIHTPGHAPDHLCFLDEESATLFCGDLATRDGTVVIPASRGGCLVDYLDSLDRVRALAPRRLLPAHGEAITDPASLLTRYAAHRRLRERQVLRALATSGATETDPLVDRVYGALPAEIAGAARETVLAHLAKLVAEGRVRSTGAGWVLTPGREDLR